MPLLNDLWRQSEERGDFSMVMIACERPDTADQLRPTLERYDVQFPVLSYLDGERPGKFDWDVTRFTSDFLVDPQGVLVGRLFLDEGFSDVLDALKSYDGILPRRAVSVSAEPDAGGGISLSICTSDSRHESFEIAYSGRWFFPQSEDRFEYAFGDGEIYATQQVEFGQFGDALITFDLPPRQEWSYFYYWAAIKVPGLESYDGGEGLMLVTDHTLTRIGTAGDSQ